jgi:hypothetical protein
MARRSVAHGGEVTGSITREQRRRCRHGDGALHRPAGNDTVLEQRPPIMW